MFDLDTFIEKALLEDIGDGDHTSLACIPKGAIKKAKLLVKDNGILAGVELAQKIFKVVNPKIAFNAILQDGCTVKKSDIAFTVEGDAQSIFTSERLVLNCMQRMSGIATTTRTYVDKLQGLKTRVLDTRKTTPCCRTIEKWAVEIGGGTNHRYGLYDMILIKDNHVDCAGGVTNAIQSAKTYLNRTEKKLAIEVEVRDFKELDEAIICGGISRIMMDNFTPEKLKKAVEIIDCRYETEASGGITFDTIRSYAETGVDYVSVGALTHSVKSLDMSLKAMD